MYVPVKQLPPVVQRALASVGYGRADVEIQAREGKVEPMWGDAGMRGFAIAVDLAKGEFQTAMGSYGGPNPFEATVDDVPGIPVVPGILVIRGQSGGRPTSAKIFAHPSNMAAYLPSGGGLSERELIVLYAFKALKGGEYRRQHFRDYKVKQSEIDALEAKGLIKTNKAGATQITTEGRNAFPAGLWQPPSPYGYTFSGMGGWSPPWSR